MLKNCVLNYNSWQLKWNDQKYESIPPVLITDYWDNQVIIHTRSKEFDILEYLNQINWKLISVITKQNKTLNVEKAGVQWGIMRDFKWKCTRMVDS